MGNRRSGDNSRSRRGERAHLSPAQRSRLEHHQRLARSRSPGFDSTDEEEAAAAAAGEEAAAAAGEEAAAAASWARAGHRKRGV